MSNFLPGPYRGLKIGLFGGSFDPAHDGHAHVAETAFRRLGLDWVWWIPARGNPLKERRVSYLSRFASAQRMANHPRMKVSDIEERRGITYTIDLIKALQAAAPSTRFVWLMGGDNLTNFHRWANWQEIADRIPIAVVARPGAGPKARLSKFAQKYNSVRVPEYQAQTLPNREAPAWTYLTAPWNASSSTALRRQARARNPFRTR